MESEEHLKWKGGVERRYKSGEQVERMESLICGVDYWRSNMESSLYDVCGAEGCGRVEQAWSGYR